MIKTARRLVAPTAVSVALGLSACAATTDSQDDDDVVMRTQEASTVVTTVELSDGSVRTVLVDAAGEERMEAIRNPEGEFAVLLDGEAWGAAALNQLEVDALHETLHDVGETLPELGAAPSATGKADGATDAVVPGFYWDIPSTGTITVDSCWDGNGPLSGDHEFTGEPVSWSVVYEVTDVTPTSYTLWRRATDGEGNLRDGGEEFGDFSYRLDCKRAGPTFAACDVVEKHPSYVPTFDMMELVRWDRPGGGYRDQLAQMTHSCDPDKYPDQLDEGFCEFVKDIVLGVERLPCVVLSRGTESRPTDFPVIDEP